VGIVVPAYAQNAESLVVVVNSNSSTDSLSKKQLIDIYMGRFNKFPNGDSVMPVDFDSPSENREKFYEMLVGLSERKVNAYWSRLLFSGRATPPKKAESVAEVISIIQNDTSALAYVTANDVQKGMKIVYEF
jgi:ABC-type phosphate transport system substrate-binding protein